MAKVTSCSKCHRITKEAVPVTFKFSSKRGCCFRKAVNFRRLEKVCTVIHSIFRQSRCVTFEIKSSVYVCC